MEERAGREREMVPGRRNSKERSQGRGRLDTEAKPRDQRAERGKSDSGDRQVGRATSQGVTPQEEERRQLGPAVLEKQ